MPGVAAAQVSDRLELGFQVSFMSLDRTDSSSTGFGGRATFDLTRWLAVEGEITLFPNDDFVVDNAPAFVPTYNLTYRRSRTEGLFGVKAGGRAGRVGVFGKARVGFTRLEHGGLDCGGPGCAVILLVAPSYRSERAVDLGGAVEFYPAAGATVRFDLGDTIIAHRSAAPPCNDCTTHNLTSRIGIGIRF